MRNLFHTKTLRLKGKDPQCKSLKKIKKILDNHWIIVYIYPTFSKFLRIYKNLRGKLINIITTTKGPEIKKSNITNQKKEETMKKLSFKKLTPILCLVTAIHLLPYSLRADSLNVCINEIAWMGTEASSTDEWIELYNNTDTDIDLTNYILAAEDGSPEIILTNTIKANSCFLMERSDDNTVSDIPADLIYTGSLGNTGEHLVLKDSTGAVIDRVNCSDGWFGGDNTNKISLERISPVVSGSDSANWDTNNGLTINGTDAEENPVQGTPGEQNSVYESQAAVKNADNLPEQIRHLYNYPNPFNPSTRIYINLSSKNNISRVSIDIFNISGQKVRALVKEKQVQGEHSVIWDGLDDRGRELPSGIYFLHLYNTKQIIETAKMLKLK